MKLLGRVFSSPLLVLGIVLAASSVPNFKNNLPLSLVDAFYFRNPHHRMHNTVTRVVPPKARGRRKEFLSSSPLSSRVSASEGNCEKVFKRIIARGYHHHYHRSSSMLHSKRTGSTSSLNFRDGNFTDEENISLKFCDEATKLNDGKLKTIEDTDTDTYDDDDDDDDFIEDDGRQDEIVEKIVNYYYSSSDKSNKDDDGGDGMDNDGIVNGKNYYPYNNRRANVQLAPGYGKTLVALKTFVEMMMMKLRIMKERSSSYYPLIGLYVTKKLKLTDQALNHGDKHGVLNFIPHRNRLIVGSKTNRTEERTTSSEEIAEFLISSSEASECNDENVKFIVSTYASLNKVGEAMEIINQDRNGNNKKEKILIDFGIFDEAHAMEGIGKQSGYGLYDSNIPIEYRFFMTGTPRNYVDNPKRLKVLGTKQRKNDGGRQIVVTSPSSASEIDNKTDVVEDPSAALRMMIYSVRAFNE